VDNSSPCLSPTTISKLGDIFPCFSGFVCYYYFQGKGRWMLYQSSVLQCSFHVLYNVT
jgi:hypothetical protein